MKQTINLTCAALGLALALGTAGCRQHFEEADVNQNGKLEVTELDAPLAEALHRAGDKNRDGNLTYAEWIEVYPKSNKAKFNKYDTDGTTGLSLAEATTALSKEGTFRKVTNKIDTNRDGVIDRNEAAVFHDAMEAADGENKVQQLENLINS